jgi:hypothetical protein
VALQILGALGRGEADLIQRAVEGERDHQVRAEGMRAMAMTGSSEYFGWLVQKMRPPGESDPKVQAAAREAYVRLLPSANRQKLEAEANRQSDPALRVLVRRELVKQLDDAGEVEFAAAQRQNIGDDYLTKLNQPADAVPYLRAALNYWQSKGVNPTVTTRLVPQLINAMLQARQYVPLADLGEELIKQDSDTYQTEVGYRVRNEAEALIASRKPGDVEAAAALIDAVLNMDPGVGPRYRPDMEKLAKQAAELRGAGPSPAPR